MSDTNGTRDRNTVIEQVRKLWRLADHPNTPPAEAALAADKARELMARYFIEEMAINEAADPKARETIVVGRVRISEEGRSPMVKDQRIALAWVVSRHNRCRAIVQDFDETVDVDTGRKVPAGVFLTIVGYKSDVDWIREFYYGLAMDLISALLDEPSQKANYQAEFAAGYVKRIEQRLTEMGKLVETKASEGSLLPVLRSRENEVKDSFDKMFPPESLRKVTVARRTYDPNARTRGARAADRADVGQGKMGTGRAGEVGPSKKELQ